MTRKLWLFLGFSTLLYIIACRKIEQNGSEVKSSQAVGSPFFSKYSSNNAEIKSVMKYLDRRNDVSKFIEPTIKKIGYPHWDKVRTKSLTPVKPNQQSGRLSSEEDTTVFCIPFSRDNEYWVNAFMVVKATVEDTLFYFVCDWQYNNLKTGDDGMNAKVNRFAAFFMSLDRSVFFNRHFNITDTSLFRNQNRVTSKMFLPDSISEGSKIGVTQVCQSFVQTIVDCPYVGWACCTPTCDRCNLCVRFEYFDVCWDEMDFSDYGIFSSGGGSGGSGGGGTGNPTGDESPPTCPGGSGGKTTLTSGCGPGWQPIFSEDEDPILDKLKKISIELNNKGISTNLMSKAAANKSNEYCMTIVKKDGLYDFRNEKTDNSPAGVDANWNIAADETLEGVIHTHHNASTNLKDRSGPSGGDVYYSLNRPKGFVNMIECGNVRFALIVTDPIKFKAFTRKQAWWNFHNAISDKADDLPNWYNDWQKATQDALVILLGSSKDCGLSFYVSTNTEKTEYKLLNP